MQEMIRMKSVRKENQNKTTILDGVDISIGRGEFVSISGVPGSGKTTLLNIIALRQKMDSGIYLLDGYDVRSLQPQSRNGIRNGFFATLFFDDALFEEKEYTPRSYCELSEEERIKRAADLLKMLNGSKMEMDASVRTRRTERVVNEQKLKFELASIINRDPDVVVVDEPPGVMTPSAVRVVVDCLKDMNRDYGTTIIFATNNPEIAGETGRNILLSEGRAIAGARSEKQQVASAI